MPNTPVDAQGTRQDPLPNGFRILILFLLAKLVWDLVTISLTWPDFSRPKFGVAVALPVIIWGLARARNWALNLAGVTCFFWIAFLVARAMGPMFTLEPLTTPFPWSNLLAFPAIVYVLNNLKTDAELRDQSSDTSRT